MSFVYWTQNADGDWGNGGNWSGGAPPSSLDAVTISTATVHTIMHSVGNDFIARLTVGNDVFSMANGALTISGQAAFASTFAMSGGALTIGGAFNVAGAATLSGGTLTLTPGGSFVGGLTQTGGALVSNGTIAITGAAQLQGGSLGGSATLQASGNVLLGNYTIGGYAQVLNAHTLNQTGNVTLGDGSGINATITNQKGATYALANAVSLASGASTASLGNAGTLATLTGTGASTIGVQVTSTGTVSIGAGSTLTFRGALTSLAGSVVGAGTLGFGGGSATIAAGTTLGVAGMSLSGNGTTLSLGGNLTLSAGYTQSDGSVLSLTGVTLTLAGPAQFSQGNGAPTITGTGTVATTGTTTLGNGGTPLVLGGSITWSNTGLAALNGNLQVGNSVTTAAHVVNGAAGVFDIVGGNLRITNGSTPTSTLTNAGTLAMTANGGTSYVDVAVASTGTVSAALGDNFVFDGPTTTISGSLAGAGQISFAGGSASIAAGTTVGVAALSLYGNGTSLTLGAGLAIAGQVSTGNASTLAVAGNVSIAGGFSQGAGSLVTLGGHTLTLNGAVTFQTIGGSGTLVTGGTVTLGGGNLIGGTVIWENRGTALLGATIQIGDNSATAASLVNEVGAVFDITAGGIRAINNGSTPASTLTNHGTLEMTANGGGSSIFVDVVSNGFISVAASDNLELDGAVNALSGRLLGAGQFSLGAGTTTLAAATVITIGEFSIYHDGTTLDLGGNVTVAGLYTQSWGSTLSLGANTLTLAGGASFQQYSGAPLVTGTGTLATQGTTTLIAGGTPLTIGGGATWSNSGTVLANGAVQIGTGSVASSLINTATGTFDILGVNYGAINNGGAPVSTFTNAGLLELTANNSGVSISVDVASTGTVSVAVSDNLEFDGQANSFAGSLVGAGQVSFGQGTSTIAAGATIGIGTLAIYRSNGNINTLVETLGTLIVGGALQISGYTQLTLGGNTTVAGAFSQRDGSVLTLGAHSLTLSGTAQFQQSNGAPLVTGTGTLLTQGTTTLIGGGTPLTIGGGATWRNTGTVLDSGSLAIGNTAGTAASLVNGPSGVFEILAAGISVYNNSTPTSIFTNAGQLQMAANGGTSYVSLDLTSTGGISSAQGCNLEINGPVNSIAGTLSGTGQISFGGGATTLAGGTKISVGTLAVYGSAQTTVLTLGGDVTVGGGFSELDGSTVQLGGHTLTLAGAASFQYRYGAPTVSGPGTLSTTGTTTLVGGNTALVIGDAATWSNTGTVLDSGNLQIGNSTTVAATFVNGAGGVFDIVAANVLLADVATLATSITNAGLLEMTTGGRSTILPAVVNTGTILAQGGTIALAGAVTGAGVIEVGGGGSVGFSGSVGTGQSLTFLDAASSASITLTSPTSFGAAIKGFALGDTIDLTNVSNATATFAGGTLTFTDNTSHAVVATLRFIGAHAFTFASDGHGGTLIGDPPLGADAAGATTQAYFINNGPARETIALAAGQVTLVGGFAQGHNDRLDVSALLAGTPAAHDLANVGHYLTSSVTGADTILSLDPAGGGHGSTVAVLTSVTTSVADLLAHHALTLA